MADGHSDEGEVVESATSTPASLAVGPAGAAVVSDSDDEFSFGVSSMPAAAAGHGMRSSAVQPKTTPQYSTKAKTSGVATSTSARDRVSSTRDSAPPRAQAAAQSSSNALPPPRAAEDSDDEFDFGVPTASSSVSSSRAPPPTHYSSAPPQRYGAQAPARTPARAPAPAPAPAPTSRSAASAPAALPPSANGISKADWLAQGRNGVDNRPAWMKAATGGGAGGGHAHAVPTGT